MRVRRSFAQVRSYATESKLPFPKAQFPTPFEVFHLPRTCTTGQVKQRYYDLVKLYHPDKSASTSSADAQDEVSRRFQLITDAYELLRNPTRRQVYLRSGEGWSGSYAAFSAARHQRRPFDFWGDEKRKAEAVRKRNRATWGHAQRPAFVSGLWDWVLRGEKGAGANDEAHGPFGEGFYTSNRAEEAGSWREHWHHRGALGKNGVVFSGIAGCSLLLYVHQAWRVFGAKREMEEGWADLVREPEGDARLDADAWALASRPPASGARQQQPQQQQSSAGLAPMQVAHFVRAAETRHRDAAERLRDARAAAREPWTLVDPKCSDVDGPGRRGAPGRKYGEMYRRMLDEREDDAS